MMKAYLIITLLLGQMSTFAQNTIMIVGHRGCRGYMPENTIAGFQRAIDDGVDGIEWDVVVNGEGQLVVSHEPYFHKDFCLDREKNDIKDESLYNIYKMTQSEIEAFDCGSKIHKKFTKQRKEKATKPLLKELVEQLPQIKRKRIFFEIKSDEPEYGISQPYPAEYATLILKEVKKYRLKNVLYMSFDQNILEELNKTNPSLKLVYLSNKKNLKKDLKLLPFKPYALGLYYPTLNAKKVKFFRKQKIGIYAWTVNDSKAAEKMIDLGIDAIITDYPEAIIGVRGSYSSKPKKK